MKNGNVGMIVSYILVLIAIVAVIGVFAHFTNGFTTDFTTFYVTIDGQDIMETTGGYVIKTNSPLCVHVKYAFGAPDNEQNEDFSFKIVPNQETEQNLEFTVDGEIHYIKDEIDLTTCFDIEKGEKTLAIASKGTLNDALKSLYSNSEISDCTAMGYADMFTLIVISSTGADQIKINFALSVGVSGIAIDKEVIEI